MHPRCLTKLKLAWVLWEEIIKGNWFWGGHGGAQFQAEALACKEAIKYVALGNSRCSLWAGCICGIWDAERRGGCSSMEY